MAKDNIVAVEPPSLDLSRLRGTAGPADPQLPGPQSQVTASPSEASSSTQASPPMSSPPPMPGAFRDPPNKSAIAAAPPPANNDITQDSAQDSGAQPPRRAAKRRPAGPPRARIAANDDSPSIGGLIYALDQKPDNTPFRYAMIASLVWTIIGLGFAWVTLGAEYSAGASLGDVLTRSTTFFILAATVVPIAVLWFLALLAWRSEELRLRSSTMTEVAIRLAEPDRMAEQSIASLGQAVRRQVSFMNDAVSRALGRAGELEALVHNEVAALERSYEENERRIRGLIQELSGERHALLNTSERVTDTLRTLGTDVPALIDKLSNQQIKLATIIQSAGENLSSLEMAVGQSTGRLEETLGNRTDQLQLVLSSYTDAIGSALGHRTEEMQQVLEGYTNALAYALESRGETLQITFNNSLEAVDQTLAARAQTFDHQLIDRTRALDAAFSDRLRQFDDAIMRSTMAMDSAVTERSMALTSALDNHAKTFANTIQHQTQELDEQLVLGISSVRRTSENITRQSLKAIEGLAGQSELLRNVSENLLGQINQITGRFENQSQGIMRAANSLEAVNYKIDTTLQTRHAELSRTLDRMSGKADEFGRFIEGYSSTIEGSLNDAEARVRTGAEELRLGTEATRRAAVSEIERLKLEADAEGTRALDDLRNRFASVSNAVSQQIDSLSSRVDAASGEARQRAAQVAETFQREQVRLREQMDQLPLAARENAEAMRRSLSEQIRALEHLTSVTARAQGQPPGAPLPTTLTGGFIKSTEQPPPTRAAAPVAPPPFGRPPMMPEARDAWSLGDLLARASRDDESGHGAGGDHGDGGYKLNVSAIARSLDPATASAIWSRLNAGHRGVIVRNFYTNEGRALFDEISRRLVTDGVLQRTVGNFLEDFERIRRDAEARDPSGRLAQSHLVSDTGRVYLFLAHAAGRIS